MANFFFTLIIFPIQQLIEIIYLFVFRTINNHGISIIGVSLAVSILTLPLYLVAEKHQKIERDITAKLKPYIKKIKNAFSGDEQYMLLSVYYRQNHYHPIFAMRNTLNLLIQIPFFIAAYTFISHLRILDNVSFFFIKNLSQSDKLLSIGSIKINILPIIMTLVNILNGYIYTRSLDIKDKLQVFGISLIFLVLLYNSPSALVIYWTMNNLFSLFKIILLHTKHWKKIIFSLLFILVLSADIFLIFFHTGDLPNRLLAMFLVSSVLILPIIIIVFKKSFYGIYDSFVIKDQEFSSLYFILPCIILFLLNGGVIPSALIASSVEEFSFLGEKITPFPFIINTLLQSAGIFLVWPLCIYFLFSASIKKILLFLFSIFCTISIVNVFLIKENFGFITTTMVFSEPKPFSLIPYAYIFNILILLFIIILIFFLLFTGKKRILISIYIIAVFALLGNLGLNLKQITDNFAIVQEKRESLTNNSSIFESKYTLSKDGKNIILILLDSVVGSFVPYVMEERPDLLESFSGFTWYPNSVSFANHTLIGALPLYGGYEYTPVAINERNDVTLLDKQKEAYLLLPKIFSSMGFKITVTDPPFDNFQMSNLSIFSSEPDIKAENLIGVYTSSWLGNHKDISTFDIAGLLEKQLIRFSFFKSSPLFLRLFIYDKGKWLNLSENNADQLSDIIINDYVFLDMLSKITDFSESGDTYTAIYAHLPHDNAFLQAPDFLPVQNVSNKGKSILAEDTRFHLMTASFIMLGKWFNYLKENGAYDNTRIILVSDHGRGSTNNIKNFRLPNGDFLQSYNVLLMSKDFNSDSVLSISEEFMTNGDAPILALDVISQNPLNPFTQKPIVADKDNGIAIATVGAVSTYRHSKYGYNIANNQWLTVKDDIFEPENWKVLKP